MIHRRLRHTPDGDVTEINISPLIDIIFILLIFFIVTTHFVEETGVEVEKPVAASGEQVEKTSVLIAVNAEGRIFYGGEEIGMNRVRATVARLMRERVRPVVILADRDSRSGVLVSVIDESKLAGATQVNIATREGE